VKARNPLLPVPPPVEEMKGSYQEAKKILETERAKRSEGKVKGNAKSWQYEMEYYTANFFHSFKLSSL